MNTRHTLRLLRTFALAALTTVATVACSDDNGDPDGSEPITPGTADGIPVAFSADINPGSDDASAQDGNPSTRTVLTPDGNGGFTVAWKGKDNHSNPDKINIWGTKAGNTWANSGSHKVYIPTTSTASSALEPQDEQNKLTLTSAGEWTFTAVYGSSSCRIQECSVKIEPQTQSMPSNSEHIADKDFSVATATQTVEESNSDMPQQIGFKFKHKLSALQLNITNSTGLDFKVQEIRLSVDEGQITTERNYDVKTGGWDATKNVTEDYQLLKVGSPATCGTKAQAFYMLLFPGHAGNTMTITVITDRGEYTLTKDAPADGFKEGTNYTTDIKIKSSGLSDKETWTEIIHNVAQLKDFRDRVNNGPTTYKGHVRIADGVTTLDLNNEEWTPIGIDNNAGKRFEGTFDGRGVTIKNMKVSSPPATSYGSTYGGFFGCVDGTIKNLIVEGTVDITTTNHMYAGGICGYIPLGKIEFCRFSGTVSSTSQSTDTYPNNYAGGIAGQYPSLLCCISDATVTQSISQGNATYTGAGGLLGKSANSAVAVIYSAWNSSKTTAMIGKTTQSVTTTGTESFTDISGLNGLLQAMNNGSPDSEFMWQAGTDNGSPVLVKRTSSAN